MERGWAAVQDGNILVETVSPHDRAAMVNWLVTRAGFMVPAGMGDFAIREHFDRLAKPEGVSVKRVNIEVS
jgi:hypothetical protein